MTRLQCLGAVYSASSRHDDTSTTCCVTMIPLSHCLSSTHVISVSCQMMTRVSHHDSYPRLWLQQLLIEETCFSILYGLMWDNQLSRKVWDWRLIPLFWTAMILCGLNIYKTMMKNWIENHDTMTSVQISIRDLLQKTEGQYQGHVPAFCPRLIFNQYFHLTWPTSTCMTTPQSRKFLWQSQIPHFDD